MEVNGNNKQLEFTILTLITSRSVPLIETRNLRLLSAYLEIGKRRLIQFRAY